jgi:hypothetical protein
MPIYLGASEIESGFDGSTELQNIYIGAQEIWSNSKVINLGTGTSFDVSSIYSKYDELTANNFFIMAANTASGTSGTGTISVGSGSAGSWGFQAQLVKSYNSSTGILTAYNAIKEGHDNSVRGTGSVTAVLVVKTENLINLGSVNGTISVTSYGEYRNFTNDNFLIISAASPAHGNSYYHQSYAYSDSGSGTSTITKSYNATNGTLTANIKMNSTDTSGVYNYYTANEQGAVYIYLNPKV